MPNSTEHSIAGCATAVITYILIQKSKNEEIDWGKAVTLALVGCFVGLLPDIIEPATNPNHRSSFHSIIAALGLAIAYKEINENPNITQEQRSFLLAIVMAYGSHLVLDSTTQRSLPSI